MPEALPPAVVDRVVALYREGKSYREIRTAVEKELGVKCPDAAIAKYAKRAGLTGRRSTSPRRKELEEKQAREHGKNAGSRFAPPAPEEVTRTKETRMSGENDGKGASGAGDKYAMKAKCSGCGSVLGIAKDEVGKQIDCPSCGVGLWATAP